MSWDFFVSTGISAKLMEKNRIFILSQRVKMRSDRAGGRGEL